MCEEGSLPRRGSARTRYYRPLALLGIGASNSRGGIGCKKQYVRLLIHPRRKTYLRCRVGTKPLYKATLDIQGLKTGHSFGEEFGKRKRYSLGD